MELFTFLFIASLFILNSIFQKKDLTDRAIIVSIVIGILVTTIFQAFAYFDLGHTDPLIAIAVGVQLMIAIICGMTVAVLKSYISRKFHF